MREGEPPSDSLMHVVPECGGTHSGGTLQKAPTLTNLVIYGDEEDDQECCICMDQQKSVVFVPCGEFFLIRICKKIFLKYKNDRSF